MKEFMYLFLGGNASEDMPEDEREKHQQDWDTWMDELEDENVLIDGMPLEDEMATLSSAEDVEQYTPVNMDAEVTGYLILECETFEKAIELAKGCPIYQYNGRVQVRQLMSAEREEAAAE